MISSVKVAQGTVLTRRTVVKIPSVLRGDKNPMLKYNPEGFISKIIRLINEQKSTIIVAHITYKQTIDNYDSNIFTAGKSSQTFLKAYKANKAVQDYMFTNGTAEQRV